MCRQRHRGRATRLDALRPETANPFTHVGSVPAYRPSAPALRHPSVVVTHSASVQRSRSSPASPVTWRQLRRRKVGQWAMVYATGAWGFLQGLGYVADLFGWPQELPRVVALALLAGLPEVLVVAWFHGARGEQRVTGTELTLVTVLFLLGGSVFWAYQHVGNPVDVDPGAPVNPSPSANDFRHPVVAVLPFESRTDAADSYFVDGVHEQLLARLTKAASLRVVARTAVARFRGSHRTTQQLAAALGADLLVEGSVQRSGHRVRVTVQLVSGDNALALWAEHYDRELTKANEFEVQGEVAVAVGDAVEKVLAGSVVRQEATASGRATVVRVSRSS